MALHYEVVRNTFVQKKPQLCRAVTQRSKMFTNAITHENEQNVAQILAHASPCPVPGYQPCYLFHAILFIAQCLAVIYLMPGYLQHNVKACYLLNARLLLAVLVI